MSAPFAALLALAGSTLGCAFRLDSAGGSDRIDAAGGSDAVACSASCALGCDPTNTRCLELVPSNGIDPAWVGLGSEFSPAADVVIDTDQGTIDGVMTGVVYHQAAAVDCGGGRLVGIGVFSFTTITIADGITVRAVGTRALGLIASGAITIEGVIDVGGGTGCADPPRCAGVGGFAGGMYDAFDPESGAGPGGGGPGFSNNGPGNESGGGGGASCGGGGVGGDDGSGSYLAGGGGVGYLDDTLSPLCGGSGGGAGGPASYASDPGARGGGGGGAIQLVSATAVLVRSTAPTPSGITAAGAGGQGDKAQTIDDGAGGGGGGGAILIEAPRIEIAADAALAANGGGGGGGYNSGAIANDGTRGQLSATAAPGGAAVRRGGDGGAGPTSQGQAAPGPVGDGGAGGGGGVGRIRLHSRTGAATVAGVLSPTAGACTSEGTVTTR